jgi:hypothetical protein
MARSLARAGGESENRFRGAAGRRPRVARPQAQGARSEKIFRKAGRNFYSIYRRNTVEMQRLYGLAAYLPMVLPPDHPPALPDEVALVFYKTKDSYDICSSHSQSVQIWPPDQDHICSAEKGSQSVGAAPNTPVNEDGNAAGHLLRNVG